MAHQIQTSEYIQGAWVTRNVDIQEVMANAQQHDNRQARYPRPEPRAPPYNHEEALNGVLTKTLLPTPHTKFILLARIRHRNVRDVIFIGENAVHLKELRVDGSLCHVSSKLDLKGKVLAAKVLATSQASRADAEHGDPFEEDGGGKVQARCQSKSANNADVMPPEVIVLTLDSCDIMFLWTQQSPTGDVTFRHTEIRMPRGKTRLEHPGSLLAVDPKSRAIAVAFSEEKFILYKVKSMDEWQDDIREGRNTVPIAEERLIQNPGRMMHMDFLAPGAARDESHVILVFILAHDRRTKISCYDWDSRCALSTATARAERLSVEFEDHNPSLLIPLSYGPVFLLFYDQHISLYMNILSGTINERLAVPFPKGSLSPMYPADSKSYPRWVQWHGCVGDDEFYIAREDGRILRMSIRPSIIPEMWELDPLPFPVDKAFAALKIGCPQNPQAYVFLAAGVTSDGCVLKVEPCAIGGSKILTHLIPNWAPINDLQVAATRSKETMALHDTIVIASGRAPYGAIAELSREIKVPIEDYADGMQGCTDIWVIHYEKGQLNANEDLIKSPYAVLLVNMPLETVLLRVIRRNGRWDLEQGIAESGDTGAINLQEETLCAATIGDKFAVQINRSEALIVDRPTLALIDSFKFTEKVFAAATGYGIPYVAIAYRSGEHPILEVVEVSETGEFDSRIHIQLACEPTCIQIMDLDGLPHVLVGTSDANVYIFKITLSSLDRLCEFNLNTGNDERGMNRLSVCENAALLEYGNERTLICGTRDGLLVSLALVTSTSGAQLSAKARVRIADAAVRVTRSVSDSSVAFARSGEVLCRVHHQRPNTTAATIDIVRFIGIETEDYRRSSVTAFSQIPDSGDGSDEELAGYIFAVSDDNFLLARLDGEIRGGSTHKLRKSAISPRKRPLDSTPTKLIAMDDHSLTVSSVVSEQVRPPPNGYRTIRSKIERFELDGANRDGQQLNIGSSPSIGAGDAAFPLLDYERVLTFAFGLIKNEEDNQSYRWLIVGTGVMTKDGHEHGRKLFFKTEGNALKLQKEKSYKEPVRCVASLPPKFLVSIHGSTMILEVFDFDQRRWKLCEEQNLQSAGVLVTEDVPTRFVYVSTTQHSHICYKLERSSNDASDGTAYRLRKWHGDSRQRSLVHHLVIDPNRDSVVRTTPGSPSLMSSHGEGSTDRLILLADKTCTVTGLSCRIFLPTALLPTVEAPLLFDGTAFEVHLPRSVTRLATGNFRPPWHQTIEGTVPGVNPIDIVGGCTDGTLYSFSILTRPALILLKSIQNLIEVKVARASATKRTSTLHINTKLSAALSPFTSNAGPSDYPSHPPITRREIDPSIGKHVPKKWHVDGDVLVRFLDGEIDEIPFDEKHGLWKLLTAPDVDRAALLWILEMAVGVLEHRGRTLSLFLSTRREDDDEGAAYDRAQLEKAAVGDVQDWVRDVTMDTF